MWTPRRRSVARVVMTLFAVLGILISGSATAFAEDAATPVNGGNEPGIEATTAPEPTASSAEPTVAPTTAPEPTVDPAVAAQDAAGTATLTVIVWFCPGTTDDFTSDVYPDVADAPDHSAEGCSQELPAPFQSLAPT